MNVKARIIKTICSKGEYRIFACVPSMPNTHIKLNKFGNFTIVGELCYLDEGEEYSFVLEEGQTTQYGTNYIVKTVENIVQIDEIDDNEDLNILYRITTRRLAENIHSVYPNYCRLILDGKANEIDVKKIYGVGEVYNNCFIRLITEKYRFIKLISDLSQYELNITDCKDLANEFGTDPQIVEAFEKKPYYCLIDVLGRSFDRVDRLIMEVRSDLRDSDQRIEHLILDILDRNEVDGNSRLNGSILYRVAKEDYCMDDLLPRLKEVAVSSELIYYDEDTKDLSRMDTYVAEKTIAEFIKDKLHNPQKLDIDWKKYQQLDNMTLTDDQIETLRMVCENDIGLLVGYSGTGKSASTKGLIAMLDENHLTYTLVAPTGKASLVLSNSTHREATTIHRKCYSSDINTDVLIVDETSMVALDVFSMLINSIANPNIKVLLVGDHAQLAPLGCGKIFSDLIASNLVPKVMLTKVFRYTDDGSLYVATNIRRGHSFLTDADMVTYNKGTYRVKDNYAFIESDKESVFDNVIAEYKKLIARGVSRNDILILSPYNVGEAGTYAINNAIQNEFNPTKQEDKMTRKINGTTIAFRVGDIVINKKNDYEAVTYDSYIQIKGSNCLTEDDIKSEGVIVNGETGTVVEVLDEGLVIKFGEELYFFSKAKLNRLLLGYAISTHASQGSTCEYSISVVSSLHKRMLSKELLYVADTRCRKAHIDIGDVEAFEYALTVSQDAERRTWLLDLLK